MLRLAWAQHVVSVGAVLPSCGPVSIASAPLHVNLGAAGWGSPAWQLHALRLAGGYINALQVFLAVAAHAD
jgi:hypothetical protein